MTSLVGRFIIVIMPKEVAVADRKTEGKFNDRLRLHVLIMAAQFAEFKYLADKAGLSLTDAAGEAIQLWINQQHNMGL